MTFAPSRANRIAVAFPLPMPSARDPAPVTSATFPARRSTIRRPPRHAARSGRGRPIDGAPSMIDRDRPAERSGRRGLPLLLVLGLVRCDSAPRPAAVQRVARPAVAVAGLRVLLSLAARPQWPDPDVPAARRVDPVHDQLDEAARLPQAQRFLPCSLDDGVAAIPAVP